MKFDRKEDAVLRYITFENGQFRVRFTDGAMFAWVVPIERGVRPLELGEMFAELYEGIKQRYTEEA